jgi:hypothetical protein
MKKAVLIFSLLFTNTLFCFGNGAVPMTVLLTVEQSVDDASEFEFILGNEETTAVYFKYDGFEKSRRNGYYMNTNLFAHTNRNVTRGNYTVSIKLKSTDSTITQSYPFNVTANTDGASIVALIGKSSNGTTYIKDFRICAGTIVNPDSIFLKMKGKPKLEDSPFFEVVNNTKHQLFPYNENGNFIGNLYLLNTEKKWKSYSYFAPYQKFNCENKYGLSSDKIIAYSTKVEDCTKTKIFEGGRYKFKTEVSTADKHEPIPDRFVEKGETRYRFFYIIDLEYEFDVKE